MPSRNAEAFAQPWSQTAIESIAGEVELCGRALAELGARFETTAANAAKLASALRTAGQALAFVDEDDEPAAGVVIERLHDLKREADGLLTLWQDDVTRQYSDKLLWEARQPHDDEATRVRPRIIPPARATVGHRRTAR